MKTWKVIVLGAWMFGSLVQAQSTSINIPMDRFQFDSVNQYYVMDVLQVLKKTSSEFRNLQYPQIQSVNIQAKSDVGGASLYLRINGETVSASQLDTDASLFSQDNVGYASVQLNNRRGDISESTPIQSIELVYKGHIKILTGVLNIGEPMIVRWQDSPTGGDLPAPRPPVNVPPPSLPQPPVQVAPVPPNPSVPAPQNPTPTQPPAPPVAVGPPIRIIPVNPPAQRPVQPVPVQPQPLPVAPRPPANPQPNCLPGTNLCIGDRVANAHFANLTGIIIGIYPDQGYVAVKFGYSNEVAYRTPSQIRKVP